MVQTNGIDHIVLHCDDIHRAKKFYTEILGMTVYREDAGHVFMHAGAQGVALSKTGGAAISAGHDLNHLALKCGRHLREPEGRVGAPRSCGRRAPGEDHCIYFRDPDGHRLQLMFRR